MNRKVFSKVQIVLLLLALCLFTQAQEMELILDRSSDLFPNWDDPLVHASDREIMKYGYPGTDHLIFREGYVLSYDAKHRTAHWVCEKLNRERLGGDGKRKDNFRQDPLVDEEHRSKGGDYTNSGFDRGHLAPAEDQVLTQTTMDESFFFSNMSPQIGPFFNQHYWAYFEKKVRDWAIEDDVDSLYVITGPTYLPRPLLSQGRNSDWVTYRVIGEDQVAVPTHFFKVILREKKSGMIEIQAFLIPHAEWPNDFPLEKFLVSIDDLERATGLDFFNRLPDENERVLEKTVPLDVWKSLESEDPL